MHFAGLPVDQLLADCELRRVRRSGPGGQRRNKVETGVRLKHLPTGVVAEASERRSPQDNERIAARRLRVKLAISHRSMQDEVEPTPSDKWRERCVGGRLSINVQHVDFPTLLAEAMDVLFACNWDTREAATKLGCSTSQFERFLKLEPAALARVNQERANRASGAGGNPSR